jgi:putative ABC transport system ATP-binding protein
VATDESREGATAGVADPAGSTAESETETTDSGTEATDSETESTDSEIGPTDTDSGETREETVGTREETVGSDEESAAASPVIRSRNVIKEYESGGNVLRALKGIDITVRSGEFVAVVGPSGSGKSTLLNQLGLLDTPTEGTVSVRGTAVSDLSIAERTRLRKRTVGFVFQNFYLIPTLSAVENVKVPRLLDGDRSATHDLATDLLERVGLGDRLDHLPNQLSGGQKQRVAVARSLINEPDLVLADEPTGNLDQDTGSQVLGEFGRITDDGVAVVAVTHDEQVTEFADRTIELVDGRIR